MIVTATTIAASWAFANIPHQPVSTYLLWHDIAWVIAFASLVPSAMLLIWFIRKTLSVDALWAKLFTARIIFFFALLPIILAVRDQLVQIILIGILLVAFFLFIRKTVTALPNTESAQIFIDTIFSLVFVTTTIVGAFQYFGYAFSLIDAQYQKTYTVVVGRTFAITLLWMAGAAIASFWFRHIRSIMRFAGWALWSLAFLFFSLVWVVNIGILYYSGLHIGPSAFEHLTGAETVLMGRELIIAILSFLVIAIIVGLTLVKYIRTTRAIPAFRGWIVWECVVVILAISTFMGTSFILDSGEDIIIRTFTDYYFGRSYVKILDPILAEKIKRFGLVYRPNENLVSQRDKIYNEKNPAPKLAERFATKRPNILVLFLESFSGRLTSVYNQRFPGLTPGLEKMASDRNTTVFTNFFNVSSPTETGMLADLCSFLPPTGHGEIIRDGSLTRHQLLCVPEMLKKNGYRSTFYITGVDRTYASKDKLLGNTGVDTIYGQQQHKGKIPGKPLSWGYSDHQLFPILLPTLEQYAKEAPFFGMMTTIDSHPPFSMSKDRVSYEDDSNAVLSAFHSTDHAFTTFWDDFKKSSLAENTIVVAIADHAVFPTTLVKELFPEEANTIGYYDQIAFLMYIPDSPLPKKVDTISSSLDFAPTLMHILGINVPNTFEGRSIFDDRKDFPNLIGMNDRGIYINQDDGAGGRKVDTGFWNALPCPKLYTPNPKKPLTLCDLNELYQWKRTMLEEGRLWKKRLK